MFAGTSAAYLTILQPDPAKGQSIPQVRRRFLRNNRTWRILWTVETGAQAGRLHLNIITDLPHPILPRGIQSHHDKIRTTPGHVAAYISKQSQHPHHDDYPGPTFGTAGPLARYMLAQRISKPVAALTAQHLLTATDTIDLAAKTDPSARKTARAALARCRAVLNELHPPQRTALFNPIPPPPPLVAGATATRPTHGRARQ